ncbi:MAG TPA: hypothetical protein VGD78_10590 [Chthoniobacterales bacterium]
MTLVAQGHSRFMTAHLARFWPVEFALPSERRAYAVALADGQRVRPNLGQTLPLADRIGRFRA